MLSVEKNRQHYTALYDTLKLETILERAKDLTFFNEAVEKHTSWFGMYLENFASRLAGKRVLELGFGDGLNALIMARLGANVTAVEIAPTAVRMLEDATRALDLPVNAVCGDFLEMEFEPFDLVVGKAVLHHLDLELEDRFLERSAALLKPEGEARFHEPAVNSNLLDSLRWIMPAPGRPSILSRRAFAKWKAEDPHPERDQSSTHYESAGRKYFGGARVITYGGIERFRRWIPDRRHAGNFARWALHAEPRLLPASWGKAIARAQTIIYTKPIKQTRH